MRHGIPDWRDEAAYEEILSLSPQELAWEWLRRNDSYRAEYRRVAQRDRLDHPVATAFARDWGLRFPG